MEHQWGANLCLTGKMAIKTDRDDIDFKSVDCDKWENKYIILINK